jgi:hypothetical protein
MASVLPDSQPEVIKMSSVPVPSDPVGTCEACGGGHEGFHRWIPTCVKWRRMIYFGQAKHVDYQLAAEFERLAAQPRQVWWRRIWKRKR